MKLDPAKRKKPTSCHLRYHYNSEITKFFEDIFENDLQEKDAPFRVNRHVFGENKVKWRKSERYRPIWAISRSETKYSMFDTKLPNTNSLPET